MRALLAPAAGVVSLLLAGCPIDDAGFSTVEVVDNPGNVLSAWVRWTSDVAGRGAVEFGADGTPAFAVREDAAVVDHELFVFGMHAETVYQLWPTWTGEDGTVVRGDPIEYTTGTTPFADLVLERTAFEPDRMQPGWTLTNVAVGSALYPATAVILDAAGAPIWYHRLSDIPCRADLEVTLCGEDHICIGGSLGSFDHPVEIDLAGEVIWEGPVQPDVSDLLTPDQMHHSFSRLDNGNYLVMRLDFTPSTGLAFDKLREIRPDGTTAWTWQGEGPLAGTGFDYPWGNNVVVDLEQDLLYYNSRNLDTLFAIDRSSAEIEWAFGRDGNYTFVGEDEHPWFIHSHAPEVQPNGNVLIYDNGNANRSFSRVVEYAVDHTAMTAEIVWEYPGSFADDLWYDFSLGDADRLPNGNTLVTAASLLGVDTEDSPSHFFEVTPDGHKVWELWLSKVGGDPSGAFAAERIPVLVEEL